MERYLAKITSLLVEPAGSPASLCKIFIAKPTVEKELTVGKLFGFAEITQPHAGGAELINRLLEQLKNDLYGNSSARRQAAVPLATADFGEQFNNLLQQSNTALAQVFESGRAKISLDDCNLLVANLRQQELAVAAIGKVTGYLLHYRASRDYQVITITEPNLGTDLNPLRLFSQSITGLVGPLDYAFFCTESILDYLSLHTITTIITQNAGAEAVRQLKQALIRANPKATAAAMIVSLIPQRPSATEATLNLKTFDYAGAAAKDSMRTLHQNQQRTSQMLSPRLRHSGRNISRWLKDTLRAQAARIRHLTAKKLRPKPTDGGEPATLAAVKKNLSVPTHAVGVTLRRIWRACTSLARLARHNPVAQTLTGVLLAAWHRFRRVPAKRQLAIVGSLALAILLGYNLVALQSRNSTLAREKAFAAVLEQAERKRDAARETLIYQDEGESRLRLNEGLQVLSQLPADYHNHPTVVRLRRELTGMLNELRHEIVIAEPLQLANFSNLDDQARAAAILVKLGDRLYTQNARTKDLLTLNLTTRAIATVQPSPSLPSNIHSATNAAAGAVLLDGERRLLRLAANEQVRPLGVNLPAGTVVAVASFRDRLYLLDTASGTVFRADPAGGGYGTPRNWIADPSLDLRTGVDLALDGDLYALRSDGQLVKLRQGRITEFTLQPIDPPLSGPTKLKTSEASGFLYILDPPTKRVVVISKKGTLVRQYRAAAFDELLDLVADEAGQTLYLLNGTRIYAVPMEHLLE